MGAFGVTNERCVFRQKCVATKIKYKSEPLYIHPILMTFLGPIEKLYINQLKKFQLNILKITKLMIVSVLQMPMKC